MSEIERLILSRDFPYLQPYFYNHPWALRCELGQGRSRSAFRRKARERAEAIYHVLFPNPADAVIFNYRLEDWSNTGPALTEAWEISAEEAAGLLKANIRAEVTQLRFLESMQNRYRHTAVRDLPFDGVEGVRRHRIVCYADEIGFDDLGLLRRQLRDEGLDISLVSFANECILSVYDDRGCDIVFASREKLAEFYPRLEPFFLDYDREEMARRYGGATCCKSFNN